MIYDKIENAGEYKGISKNLDVALDFIMKTDLQSLTLGRNEIMGDKVFANVMDAMANATNDGVFEYHKDYMDIQIDIAGVEKVEFADKIVEETTSYSPDIGFAKGEKSAVCVLGQGYFTICMTGELHKPSLSCGIDDSLRKVVLKVKREP